MKKVLGFAALAALAGGGAHAQMDQIGTDGSAFSASNVVASQWFEEANQGFRIGALDDFSVDSTNNSLQTLEVVMGGWNGFAGQWDQVAGWRVEFYSSPQAAEMSLEGDVASLTYGMGGYAFLDTGFVPNPTNFQALIGFDLDSLVLSVGTYWVAVIPEHTFGGGGGQVGVAVANAVGGTPGGLDAWQANPNGGFGFTLQQIVPASDLAYRITGVPAPGALALLGVAGLVARRRRRA